MQRSLMEYARNASPNCILTLTRQNEEKQTINNVILNVLSINSAWCHVLLLCSLLLQQLFASTLELPDNYRVFYNGKIFATRIIS